MVSSVRITYPKKGSITVDNKGLDRKDVTLDDVQSNIEAHWKLKPVRQRLKTNDGKVVFLDEDLVSELTVKDLGPQISWKLVFILEYLGPLVLHPFIYSCQQFFYNKEFEHSTMQAIAMRLMVLHYAKREIESLFVHRFSSSTMPLFNLFKNCFHYWVLGGLVIAYPLYAPHNGEEKLSGSLFNNMSWLTTFSSLFCYAEAANLMCHWILRGLRNSNTRERQIPNQFAFIYVTSANYFFEILVWVAFTFLTGSPFVALFTVVSTLQMASWAKKKHERYLREFPDYPQGRKILIPFVW